MAAIMVIITAACPVVQAVLLYAAGGIKCIIMHDRGSRGFWLPFCNHFVVDIVDQLVLYLVYSVNQRRYMAWSRSELKTASGMC